MITAAGVHDDDAAWWERRMAWLQRMAGPARGVPVVGPDGEPLIQPGVLYDRDLPASLVPARHWVYRPSSASIAAAAAAARAAEERGGE